jgi:hypothetical protein
MLRNACVVLTACCISERAGAAGAAAVDEAGRPRGAAAVRGAMLDWWLLSGAADAVLS